MAGNVNRRVFLRSGAMALLALGIPPAFVPRTLRAATLGGARRKTLICIFQRGAVDGLNMVVPYGEAAYRRVRPTIAIPAPGQPDGALDLDGFFGFHPSLDPLHDLYRNRTLSIVHAVGSPHPTRSHFEAQAYMETALPGDPSAREGWLNRVLAETGRTLDDPEAHAHDHRMGQMAVGDGLPSALRAVAAGPALPLSLRGGQPAFALGGGDPGGRRGVAGAASETLDDDFRRLYASSAGEVLGRSAGEAFRAMETLRQLDPVSYRASVDADYPPDPFGNSLRQIAQLVKADVGVEVAFADLGGWDTHRAQGGSRGTMAQRLEVLGRGVRALHDDLGPLMDNVVILTMSEFGRTVRENGGRGTDHGHANCMLVIGGAVRGGRILGDWPGLEPELLHDGRDLARTTDFRDVFGEVVAGHLGAERLGEIFPGHAPDPGVWRGVL